MGRQARPASDKESAKGSKPPVQAPLSRRRGAAERDAPSPEPTPAERLDRLERRVVDLEKRVFELEQTSGESTSPP
jgi:hypothetical protein